MSPQCPQPLAMKAFEAICEKSVCRSTFQTWSSFDHPNMMDFPYQTNSNTAPCPCEYLSYKRPCQPLHFHNSTAPNSVVPSWKSLVCCKQINWLAQDSSPSEFKNECIVMQILWMSQLIICLATTFLACAWVGTGGFSFWPPENTKCHAQICLQCSLPKHSTMLFWTNDTMPSIKIEPFVLQYLWPNHEWTGHPWSFHGCICTK